MDDLAECLAYLETHGPNPEFAKFYARYDNKRAFPAGTLVRRRGFEEAYVVCHHQAGYKSQTVIAALDDERRHVTNPEYFPEHGRWVENDTLTVIDLAPREDELEAAIESIRSVGSQREDEA